MKYRKKPSVVEAFKYTGEIKDSDGKYIVPWWAICAYEDGVLQYNFSGYPSDCKLELILVTKHFNQKVSVGDYVVRESSGAIYICKTDIFEKTYEPAE